MTSTEIETYTGIKFDLLNPTPDMVTIRNIGHAVSLLCRFTGHTRKFFSVAQHSYDVSRMVDSKYKMVGLLHDAPEAYLGDVSRPLKALLPDYQKIYKRIEQVIFDKFELNVDDIQYVKEADNEAVYREARALMPNKGGWAGNDRWPSMFCCSSDTAEKMFNQQYNLLRGVL